jgi:hypothetical protein
MLNNRLCITRSIASPHLSRLHLSTLHLSRLHLSTLHLSTLQPGHPTSSTTPFPISSHCPKFFLSSSFIANQYSTSLPLRPYFLTVSYFFPSFDEINTDLIETQIETSQLLRHYIPTATYKLSAYLAIHKFNFVNFVNCMFLSSQLTTVH